MLFYYPPWDHKIYSEFWPDSALFVCVEKINLKALRIILIGFINVIFFDLTACCNAIEINSNSSIFNGQKFSGKRGLLQNCLESVSRDKDGFMGFLMQSKVVGYEGVNFNISNNSRPGHTSICFHRLQKRFSGSTVPMFQQTGLMCQTWLFRLTVILLVIGLFGMYLYVRSGQQKRRNRILQRIVSQRAAASFHTINAIEKSETQMARQIRIQAMLIASLTHDVQSPLRALITVSRGVESSISKGAGEKAAKLSNDITASAVCIANLMQDTLDYIKVDLSGMSTSSERFSLAKLVDEKIVLFSLALEGRRNTIVNSVPLEFTIAINSSLFGIVISNLIDNANKHMRDGAILISARLNEHRVELTISDRGVGIPIHVADWINSAIGGERECESMANVSGIGLLLAKEIVRILDCDIRVVSDDRGSVFTIFVPL